MIGWLLAEVAPPPEVLLPADAAVAGALGALLGFLGNLLRPVRDAIVKGVQWVFHSIADGTHILWGYVGDVNQGVANVRSWAGAEIQGLVNAVSSIHPSTIVQVTTTAVAGLDQVYKTIDGAENYAISVSEDLYNRAVNHADAAAAAVAGTAAHWVDDVAAQLRTAVGDVSDRVGWVFGTLEQDVAQVRSDADAAAQSALSSAIGYADDLVRPLPGMIADLKPWATGAIAVAGAEVFAKVITTVQSLYDPCCEFTTDQVRPQWDKVKNLLGKLTRRGPLALVVLGAASEVVVALDRPTIVAMLKQARADDNGVSLAVLQDWRRPGVA